MYISTQKDSIAMKCSRNSGKRQLVLVPLLMDVLNYLTGSV